MFARSIYPRRPLCQRSAPIWRQCRKPTYSCKWRDTAGRALIITVAVGMAPAIATAVVGTMAFTLWLEAVITRPAKKPYVFGCGVGEPAPVLSRLHDRGVAAATSSLSSAAGPTSATPTSGPLFGPRARISRGLGEWLRQARSYLSLRKLSSFTGAAPLLCKAKFG